MSKLLTLVATAFLALSLALAGLGATSAVAISHPHDMTMMGQAPDCASLCLSASHAPDSAPLLANATVLLVIGLLAIATTKLDIPASITLRGPGKHARPSPNLIALYAHYLD